MQESKSNKYRDFLSAVAIFIVNKINIKGVITAVTKTVVIKHD